MIVARVRRVRRLAAQSLSRWAGAGVPVDHQPVFVLGHQKSGTSAIAALLGERAGVKATIDLQQEISDLIIPTIAAGDGSIEKLIERNRVGFSAPIVKHPNLTLIYPQLRARFPASKFVFVVRDPRDNIRSVLDRLGLAGQASEITVDEWERVPIPWKLMLGGPDDRPTESSHIRALCARWNLMADQYFAHAGEMELTRYEDFVADKIGTIGDLAAALGLPGDGDISGSVDHPFQPQGANRGADLATFFGTNLALIERSCEPNMQRLGYLPGSSPDG